MRQIKITKQTSTERDKAFEKLIAIAKIKKLSDEESQNLLDEIRSGNADLIEKLVNSFEMMVLKVARQIPTEMAIEEMIVIGRNQLIELAKQELGSTHRERYFRFAAWCVRQAILKDIIEPKSTKE